MFRFFYTLLLISLIALSATLLYQKHTYAYQTLVHIDPLPHTKALIAKEKYADADEYLGYFMTFDYVADSKEAQKLFHTIQEKRGSLRYKSNKILEGIRTGSSDEIYGQASAIGSDFFLIGDLRDLYIQGKHYLKHEKVDNVILALSSIGIVASAGTLISFGASSPAKGSISLLKLAKRTKRIPLWLEKYLIRQAKQLKKTKNIKALKPLFKNVDTLYKKVGLKNTLQLLSKTKDMHGLKSLSKLSTRYGKESTMLLKLSKGRLLKQSKYFKKFDKSTIRLASSYGDNGYKTLLKSGEKNFLKSVKRIKAYAKVGYKGQAWKLFIWLLAHISDAMLIAIMGISTLLLLPLKKIFIRRSKPY